MFVLEAVEVLEVLEAGVSPSLLMGQDYCEYLALAGLVKGWSVTDCMFCLSMDVYSTFKEKIIWPLL